MLIGADTGGTFTDIVSADGTIAKVLSTPEDPVEAVRAGIAAVSGPGTPGIAAVSGPGGPRNADDSGPSAGNADHSGPSAGRPARPELLAHGTTVATNALLERRGARVALVTSRGFADVIEIARQDRPSLYDIYADRPEPLVERALRYEVAGRLDATGAEIEPLDTASLADDLAGAEAVAVCLLHADLNPAHERVVAEALTGHGADVVLSSEVSPEFREYERTITTVVNAYLRPLCGAYLERLGTLADEVLVMTSAGGLVEAETAAALPVALLLSGPAAGAVAAAAVAREAGFPDAITLDMGGTSTDVCLVLGSLPEPAPLLQAAGFPIRMPSLDIHTIGAGGGSLARIDEGGALVVGPRSAGARPGPACYGLGGTEPTVTDANLVLGRIPQDAELPELGRLDSAAATSALAAAGVAAEGVVDVVNANMERAIRTVSIERGYDARQLALVAFGGAGPLHACDLADALGMPAVVIPPRAGVLSATGLLCSPRKRELVESWPHPLERTGLAAVLDKLAARALEAVGAHRLPGGEVDVALDCRYLGQSHELTVPSVNAFHETHRRRNGYALPGRPVEVIALRARATIPAPVRSSELPAPPERRPAEGPCVLSEADCTVWIPEGWVADVGGGGAWILTRRHP